MVAKRSSISDSAIAASLLEWYAANARVLPWRARAGERADPYRVWLSEVMLQQTTVAAVRPRFAAWVARWPTLAALAAADEADVMAAWAGLGYYARARNLVRAARAVAALGAFPTTEAGLRELPGLGAYTAAAVAAIAFGARAVVVDANVERVVARLFAISVKGTEIRAAADTITPDLRAGDFAQAMMDLGSGICTLRAPKCLLCPLRTACAGFARGTPAAFPAKQAKAAKPQRFGTIFWVERGDTVLLIRRPANGLLGGMRALPSGDWAGEPSGLADAPVAADWRLLPESVTHSFTHFDLELALAVASGEAQEAATGGEYWPIATLGAAGLPTVFAKAANAIRRMR